MTDKTLDDVFVKPSFAAMNIHPELFTVFTNTNSIEKIILSKSESSNSENEQVNIENTFDKDKASCSSNQVLTVETLVEQILSFYNLKESSLIIAMNLIKSYQFNDEIQEPLINLLGLDNCDFVEKIIANRGTLREEINEYFQRCKNNRRSKISNGETVLDTEPTLQPGLVTFQSKSNQKLQKKMLKQEKRMKKQLNKMPSFNWAEKEEIKNSQKELEASIQEMNDIKIATELSLINHRNNLQIPPEKLPYIFDSFQSTFYPNVMLAGETFILPVESKSIKTLTYQELFVPPSKNEIEYPEGYHSIDVNTLDKYSKICFENIKTLNTIQSIVFQQCYNTLENLLICAPTGAGKTNIAMLAVLKTIKDHCLPSGEISKSSFKIIYIAPMKALAAEMTQNFGKRLQKIGLKVRELTGDTQLSKKEIKETQMLILTPEKWDVLTRKSDDEYLNQLVRLIIIDEVHLLHDDRGPVIEAIVARTLRQIEVSHQMIRIVGLSATLPNYLDVAQFLRVNPKKGLFYFDSRFRPVPLAQSFVGVNTGHVTKKDQKKRCIDDVCYEKCLSFLRDEHQVIVFVHSRNATVSLSRDFLEKATNNNERSFFLPNNVASSFTIKMMNSAKSRELQNFLQNGIGIHHAGLLRSDRNLTEKMFSQGHIRLLICTATLAWGINLPAHAVIIRGTEIYDAQHGQFADIGVLDVQQIFGRAGRPQYETYGHGVILTDIDKIGKYVNMLIRQSPIESRFQTKILDNLNAEIAKGTVTNIKEAVEWLRMTYFYIRARKNPLEYGISNSILCEDKDLEKHFTALCNIAANKLDSNKMISFDFANGYLSSTDLGRIASHFYINFETIEKFNDQNGKIKLTSQITDDNILNLISTSNEFSQIATRDSTDEMIELEELASFGCIFPIKSGGLGSTEGKVNCLLQSYISRMLIKNFALISETFYVSQNASRIARALFEIVLRRGWAQATSACLQMSKSIQHKVWIFNSPLRQIMDIGLLKEATVSKIERRQMSIDTLWDMNVKELESTFSCDGKKLFDAVHMIPIVGVDASIKPITRTIVQIDAFFSPNFTWNDKISKTLHRFWIFIEDLKQNTILHYEQLIFEKKQVIRNEKQKFVFVIPINENQITNQYQIRITHDSFIVEDTILPLSLHNCILPSVIQKHTDLLDLDPLPITVLHNDSYQKLYPFEYFNPIQTQVFFTLHETDNNTLIGAPTGSGKTLCAELAIFRLLKHNPTKKCVYIAPLKALVRERVNDWRKKFTEQLNYEVAEVSGDFTPTLNVLNSSTILITTPEKWDGITRCMDTREYVKNVELIIIDEIHLLGVERGSVLEAIITRIKSIARQRLKSTIRIVGLSTALANASDIADWINVDEYSLYNFRPNVRPVPINVHIQGFPGQHYCPRMSLMNKPAYKAIRQFSDTKPVLVFVASRRQTRLTAMGFISLLALEENPYRYNYMEQSETQEIIDSVKDDNLKMTLPFGIGMHHAGLQHFEKEIIEKLFVQRKIQILVATSTLAWGINVPAHLVIIKGTEYYDGKTHKYVDFPVTDVLQMIGRAGRPQYDTSAVAVVFVQDTKKNFYKKFLYESFPVESSLLPVLPNHINAEICGGTISSMQGILDYLAGTYLYRRLFANPTYYFVEDLSSKGMTLFLNKVITNCVDELIKSKCISSDDVHLKLQSTSIGAIASKYYLNHLTVRHFYDKLTNCLTVEEVLKILSDCPEYDEIPVRHNEDRINQQICLPFKLSNDTDWESPHVKVHILYQTHFSRIEIPVDYITDLRSILESCIRIIQAMLDFCITFKWLDTALNVIILMQQVLQARWYFDHPLCCLPHLTDHSIEGLGPLSTIPQFKSQLGLYNSTTISRNKLFSVTKQLRNDSILEEKEAKDVVYALLKWPTLSINEVAFLEGLNQCFINIKMSEPIKDSDYTTLQTNTQYKLRFKVEQICDTMETAFCPNYPKDKTYGWILLIGERLSHTVHSSQKFNFIDSNNVKFVYVPFLAPSMPGRYNFTLYVMSDSYLGIDQEYNIYCDVKN